MANAVVIGSTGLVGSFILSAALGIEAIQSVHTISRRAPKAEGAKLVAKVEPDTTKWADALSTLAPVPDIVFSALGTTRAQAGGIANQWKIDHDLNVELAKAAHAAGVKTFVFVSSAGTRGGIGGSLPYSRMKQGVEDTVRSLGFDHAIILRPAMILGEREVPKYPLAVSLLRGIGSYVSKALQDKLGQEADVIGRAAVNAALMAHGGKAPSGDDGYWLLEGGDIIKYGTEKVAVEKKEEEP